MRHLTAALPLVALAAACADAPTPPDPADVLFAGDPVREYVPGLEEELELFGVGDLLILDDRLYIVEWGNDRVTVTDTLFNLVDRFGRRGQGPGELSAPADLELLPDGKLAIAEMENRRVSVFTAAGGFVRSVPIATAHDDVAAMNDTTFVVSGPGGPHPAVIRNGPGGAGAFSTATAPERDPMEIGRDFALRARTAGGGLAVIVRATDGRIEVYDPSGALARRDSIPTAVFASAVARAEQARESLERRGLEVVFAQRLKPPSATSDGRVFFPLAGEGPVGLLYSPIDGRFTRVEAVGSDRSRALLRRASGAYLHGETLYVVSGGGIAAFPLFDSSARKPGN